MSNLKLSPQDQKVISTLNPCCRLRLKMETHHPAASRYYGTEEDIVKRLREILFFFFLYYPSRTLSECDVLSSSELNFWQGCHIFILGMWDLQSGESAVRLYLRDVCEATRTGDRNELRLSQRSEP